MGNLVIIQGKVEDGAYEEIELDNILKYIISIDEEHHLVHSGKKFIAFHSQLRENAEIVEIWLKAPDSKKLSHMAFGIETALAATVELWLNTTKTYVHANRLVGRNQNLNLPIDTFMNMCHTPAGSQAGSANLGPFYIGSASVAGKSVIGGSSPGTRHEWLLERGVPMLIRITSRANANAVTFEGSYYKTVIESYETTSTTTTTTTSTTTTTTTTTTITATTTTTTTGA
jgi:hypothetical protein